MQIEEVIHCQGIIFFNKQSSHFQFIQPVSGAFFRRAAREALWPRFSALLLGSGLRRLWLSSQPLL